jgi:type IV pilus assembly protein PilY1
MITKLGPLFVAGFALIVAQPAFASAIIDNGTVQLGVDDFGQLNIPGGAASPVSGTTTVGLRYLPTGNEATSHGCLCEGWGVAANFADASSASGSANNDFGVSGLGLSSFSSDATSATSVVTMGALKITHAYAPAAETPNLYRVTVTIENTGAVDVNNLFYRRTFDWDVEPDTFDEFVTIGGSAAATAVIGAVDNGFCSSDPFSACSPLLPGGSGDFTDLGPSDHGANFDFDFGALLAGESFTFEIFYGGATTEADAFAALGLVGAEVFSFGQPSRDPGGTGADGSNTFIFGFAGVGGEALPPPEVPVPAALPLFLTGAAAFGFMRRRRKSAA